MKHLPNLHKVPFLFSIVCLGLFTLMAFQISWLTTSKKLIEEQFDQKVNLAMGGALTEFNARHKTKLDIEEGEQCGDSENYKYIQVKKDQISMADQQELEESLSLHMTCYGIDEKYSMDIFDKSCETGVGTYCCAINTQVGCETDFKLGVSFQAKDEYLYDNMKFMIISSVLIFILLAAISFFILAALVKQKRITENNIDFFNNTAHELKTPLTNISLALNLMTKKHDQLQESRYAQIINSESKKLTGQIERVLFLSKMESGEYDLKKENVDLVSLLKEVTNNMSMIVAERSGKLSLNVPPKEVSILGDYYHLCNVFRNLIDNALKYCDKEPSIAINLIEDGDHVKLTFLDNGIGICPEDQEHIFTKFQRVNTGNIHQTKGFGIGLSYVKTVVEMHKGLINVVSDLNKGSQFELVLPYA